jgi:hypothetical protein
VSAGAILRSCFDQLNQQLRFVFLDLIWRSIWLGCSLVAVGIFGFGMIAQLESIEWMGPDLGASNPIILITALREFWSAYGATFLSQLGLLALGVLIFWIVLEALFRGGRRGFWVYLGTSVGRLSLLAGAGAFFALLAGRDETGGTFLIGAVVILGLWFMVSLLETVIRKDALVLIAVEFPRLLAVFGTVMVAEIFLGFVLWGSVVAALKGTSSPEGGAAALAITAIAVPFWLVLHSYLIALRFSAIDIIRNAVSE